MTLVVWCLSVQVFSMSAAVYDAELVRCLSVQVSAAVYDAGGLVWLALDF